MSRVDVSDVGVPLRLQPLLSRMQFFTHQPGEPEAGETQQLRIEDIRSLVVFNDLLHDTRHLVHSDTFTIDHFPVTILHRLAVHSPYHGNLFFPVRWAEIVSIDM